MKALIISFFIFIPSVFYTQTWIPCVIDSSVSLVLTEGYKLSEHDTKMMYLTVMEGATAAVIKTLPIANDSSLVSKDKLKESYIGFRDEMLKTMNGSLVTQEFLTIQGFETMRFHVRSEMDDVLQNIYFLVVKLQSGSYVLRFSEFDSASALQQTNRETFFNSLKIRSEWGKQIPDVSDPKKDVGYRIGYVIGENLIWVLLVTLFLIVSIRSFQKSKNTMT